MQMTAHFTWNKIKPTLPNVYFAAVALFFSIWDTSQWSLLGVLVALPFLKQIIYPCKIATLLLAILALVYAVVMSVAAVLAERYAIGTLPTGPGFYLYSLFLAANFGMSAWLFAEGRVSSTENHDELFTERSDILQNP